MLILTCRTVFFDFLYLFVKKIVFLCGGLPSGYEEKKDSDKIRLAAGSSRPEISRGQQKC